MFFWEFYHKPDFLQLEGSFLKHILVCSSVTDISFTRLSIDVLDTVNWIGTQMLDTKKIRSLIQENYLRAAPISRYTDTLRECPSGVADDSWMTFMWLQLFIVDDGSPLSQTKHYRGLYVAMEKPRQVNLSLTSCSPDSPPQKIIIKGDWPPVTFAKMKTYGLSEALLSSFTTKHGVRYNRWQPPCHISGLGMKGIFPQSELVGQSYKATYHNTQYFHRLSPWTGHCNERSNSKAPQGEKASGSMWCCEERWRDWGDVIVEYNSQIVFQYAQETNRVNISDNNNPADITGGYMAGKLRLHIFQAVFFFRSDLLILHQSDVSCHCNVGLLSLQYWYRLI